MAHYNKETKQIEGTVDVYGIYDNNPSARKIIDFALDKATREHFGGPWTHTVENLTDLVSDRGPEDTGMEPNNNQE